MFYARGIYCTVSPTPFKKVSKGGEEEVREKMKKGENEFTFESIQA